MGMSARDLAQIAFETDEKALVVPAHVWTPWFSLFGSMSGFDSVEECFGDMAKYIYGIETGLSSDPAMNWRVEDLDSRAVLSFSDAHSLEKMGREATVFEANEISYESIYEAITLSPRGPVTSFPPASARLSEQSAQIKNGSKLRAVGVPSTGTTRVFYSTKLFFQVAAIPVSAFLFTAPVILFYFSRVSPIAPLANILVAEAVFPIMILGFLIAISSLIFMPLAQLLAYLAYVPALYFSEIVRLLAKLL